MIYQNVFVPLPPMRLAAGFGKERFPIIRELRQAQTDEYTPKNRFSHCCIAALSDLVIMLTLS